MGVSALGVRVSSVALAGAILAACSSGYEGAPNILGPDAAVPLAARSAKNFSVRPDRSASWMSPKVSSSTALLYITDGNLNGIYVYTWPALAPVGKLTGLNLPQGMCVDKAANIWVANTRASQILEFAHGGTSPIATLNDPGQYPLGCSVNPRNGDLAVSNISTTGSGAGSLAIYKGATGNPIIYSDPAFYRVFFLAYDSNGNLFLDGYNSSQVFQMAKFRLKKFTPITISGATINFPGGVFTKGLKLSVGDQIGHGNAIVYQITDTGTVTGTTQLLGTQDCIQYFIYGTRRQKIVGPNAVSPTSVQIYKYPAGGNPVKTISGPSLPIGSAISP